LFDDVFAEGAAWNVNGSTTTLEFAEVEGVLGMLSSSASELKSVKSEPEKLGVDDIELEEELVQLDRRGVRFVGVTGTGGRGCGIGREGGVYT
jgi:hypothetical protein